MSILSTCFKAKLLNFWRIAIYYPISKICTFKRQFNIESFATQTRTRIDTAWYGPSPYLRASTVCFHQTYWTPSEVLVYTLLGRSVGRTGVCAEESVYIPSLQNREIGSNPTFGLKQATISDRRYPNQTENSRSRSNYSYIHACVLEYKYTYITLRVARWTAHRCMHGKNCVNAYDIFRDCLHACPRACLILCKQGLT